MKYKMSLRDALRLVFWQLVKKVDFDLYVEHEALNVEAGEGWQPGEMGDYLRSRELIRRANRLNLNEEDIVGHRGEIEWERAENGARFLTDRDQRRLQRAIDDAQHLRAKQRNEKREVWIKWVTAFAAILAAIASTIAAIGSLKLKR